MRCKCCPVSPLTFQRKTPSPGCARGDGDLDKVDDVVHEDDADLKSPVVGKKHVVEQEGVNGLKAPSHMTQAEWEEHLTTHLP